MTGGATDKDYTAEYDIGIDRKPQPEEVGDYHICPHRPPEDWASIGVLGLAKLDAYLGTDREVRTRQRKTLRRLAGAFGIGTGS
jgi:hypothetical protein